MVAIDNFSEFQCNDSEHIFRNNVDKYITSPYTLITENCFNIPLDTIPNNIDLFFYDGHHSLDSQRDAIIYFWKNLAQEFTLVIDDWNWGDTRLGTQAAMLQLDPIIIESKELFTPDNKTEPWWNGLYIAKIKKR